MGASGCRREWVSSHLEERIQRAEEGSVVLREVMHPPRSEGAHGLVEQQIGAVRQRDDVRRHVGAVHVAKVAEEVDSQDRVDAKEDELREGDG